MANKGIDIKHPKLRGEWAELRFMARASELGLRVSKPFGDSARYDFAVENKGRFLRVQVKSTMSKQYNSYACNLRTTHKVPYCKAQVDFIAAYVIPVDAWYIIPIEKAVNSSSNLILSPHLPDSKYAPYREAWHLLCGKTAKRGAAATPAAATPAPTTNEASACAKKKEDRDQPEDDDTNPDDAPLSLPELRLSAIKWNPILSHWKPRR